MKQLNNKGFTLMEVIVAMAVVTLVASFVGSAIISAQKSALKTQEISAKMSDALNGSEEFLADSSALGSTEGNYKLQKVSGGLGGFPEVDLAIRDSSIGTDGGVKYVAFKRSEDNENNPAGGGAVSNNGTGLAAGDGNAGSQPALGGGIIEEETEAPTEAIPEPPTFAEIPTEANTEAPAAAEVPAEATTAQEIQNEPDRGNPSYNFGYDSAIKDHSVKYDWFDGMVLNQNTDLQIGDVIVPMYYSKYGDITSEGILLTAGSEYVFGKPHTADWSKQYRLVINVKPAGNKKESRYYVNGQEVNTSEPYVAPFTDQIKIERKSYDVYITSISVVEIN